MHPGRVHDYGLVADRIVTTFVIQEQHGRQTTADGERRVVCRSSASPLCGYGPSVISAASNRRISLPMRSNSRDSDASAIVPWNLRNCISTTVTLVALSSDFRSSSDAAAGCALATLAEVTASAKFTSADRNRTVVIILSCWIHLRSPRCHARARFPTLITVRPSIPNVRNCFPQLRMCKWRRFRVGPGQRAPAAVSPSIKMRSSYWKASVGTPAR